MSVRHLSVIYGPIIVSETLAWPGSRDRDNSTVQTAAMGQIPRSAERILVLS